MSRSRLEHIPISILFVDHSRTLSVSDKSALETLGYEVTVISSSSECIQAIKTTRPDLVLFDIVFGSETGSESACKLCREIQRLSFEPKPLVVVHSGLPFSSVEVQEGLAAGADGYINRNISQTEFLRWVEAYGSLKRSQNKLYSREREYHALFRTLTEGVVFQDERGNIIDLNPAAESILGRSREQILGKTSEDRGWAALREDGSEFTGEEHPAMQALRTGNMQKNVVMGVFNPARYEYRWIRIDAVPLTEEDIHRVYTIFSDITESKKTKDERKKLAQRLEAGLRAGNLSWWEMELPSGQVVFDDRKAEMLGYTPEQFSHYEDFNELIHPDDYERTIRAMRDHIEGNAETYEVEYRILTANGNYKWFRDIGAITDRDEETGVRHIVGIVEDITEKKEAESDLKRSREKLLKLSHHLQNIREEQSTHIAGEIHDDLGQSLTSVEMVLTLLETELDKKADGNEASESLLNELREQVNTTIEKSRNLVRDLRPTILDTARISEALEWLLDKFEQHSGISTKVDISQQVFTLGTQRDLALFRIVQEALANISHHSKARNVHFSLELDEKDLLLRIEDNGTGFPVEDFEDSEGFGLLNIRERATFLNGEFDVKSALHKGTALSLRVPLEAHW